MIHAVKHGLHSLLKPPTHAGHMSIFAYGHIYVPTWSVWVILAIGLFTGRTNNEQVDETHNNWDRNTHSSFKPLSERCVPCSDSEGVLLPP